MRSWQLKVQPPRLTAGTLIMGLIVGFGSACLFRPGRTLDPDDDPAQRTDVTVKVENANYYDATIYAVSSNSSQRLGIVVGGGTQTFRFNWSADRVHFVIDLLAVGSYPTDEILVNPGDDLELRVTPDLHRRRPGTR